MTSERTAQRGSAEGVAVTLPGRTQLNTKVEFECRTARNILAFTSSDLDLAKAYCRDNSNRLPGLTVWAVETTVVRRRAYSPKMQLRVVA